MFITVSVGEYNDWLEYIHKEYGVLLKNDDAIGSVWWDGEREKTVNLFLSKVCPSIIAHESVHLAYMWLENHGIEKIDEEILAMLVDAVVEGVYKIVGE